MSNLPHVLLETCSLVADLESTRAHGARAMRARVDLMRTASLVLRALPEVHVERLAFDELARELRDEASELRRRHRVVRSSVLAMMD
jgi:hypothetical protein